MKEQYDTSEKKLNKMGISNLLDKGFKVMVIMMLSELGRRMDKHSQKA